MSEIAHVVEDGVDSAPGSPASRPSWLLGAVGFALGLGLGVVAGRLARPARAVVLQGELHEDAPRNRCAVCGHVTLDPQVAVLVGGQLGGALRRNHVTVIDWQNMQ